MSSVSSEKLGKKSFRIQKPPIKHPQHTLTVALRLRSLRDKRKRLLEERRRQTKPVILPNDKVKFYVDVLHRTPPHVDDLKRDQSMRLAVAKYTIQTICSLEGSFISRFFKRTVLVKALRIAFLISRPPR